MTYGSGDEKEAAAGQQQRAVTVSLADFSEQLTAGVLRAVDAREVRAPGPGGPIAPRDPRFPWIWFGYWIRVDDLNIDKDIGSGFEKG